MKVEVCYALPATATRIAVDVEPGATIDDAVVLSGIESLLGLDRTGSTFAIFGRRASPETVLHDGDRVEILRPLTIAPMEARRLRARKIPKQEGAP